MMSSEIYYEDSEIKVFWHPGTSDYLVITFGDLKHLAPAKKFFAEATVIHHKINCIGFIAKKPNWFPTSNVAKALEALTPLLEPFSRRITYGHSMGGYAAIKFSRPFNATHVLAFGPQWSIDPNETQTMPNTYKNYFRPIMAGIGITQDDLSGKIIVFYDPLFLADALHCAKIAALDSRIATVKVPLANQHLGALLDVPHNLEPFINLAINGQLLDLKYFVNDISRNSPIWKRGLLEKALKKHPLLTHRALFDFERTVEVGINFTNYLNAQLFGLFIDENRLDNAQEILNRLNFFTCKQRLALLNEMLAELKNLQQTTAPKNSSGQPSSFSSKFFCLFKNKTCIKQKKQTPNSPVDTANSTFITTIHNTVIVYSLFFGKIFHTSWETIQSRPLDLYPAQLSKFNGVDVLTLQIRSRKFACFIAPNNSLNLLDLKTLSTDQLETCITKGTELKTRFTLFLRKKHISAQPNGDFAYNRDHALAWESFIETPAPLPANVTAPN